LIERLLKKVAVSNRERNQVLVNMTAGIETSIQSLIGATQQGQKMAYLSPAQDLVLVALCILDV
jgi:hypothetical protein